MPQLTPQEEFGIKTGELIPIEDACAEVVKQVEKVVRFELIEAHWEEVNGERHRIPAHVKFFRADDYSIVMPFLSELPGAVDSDVSGIVAAVRRVVERRHV